MNPNLLSIILQNVIPQVIVAVRAHHNATGQYPTDAQVIAALQLDAATAIAEGEAFLASKGAPPV